MQTDTGSDRLGVLSLDPDFGKSLRDLTNEDGRVLGVVTSHGRGLRGWLCTGCGASALPRLIPTAAARSSLVHHLLVEFERS